MTCQWCKNYRRRNGLSKCWYPFDDGLSRFIDVKPGGASTCRKFDPRRSCTTCEHRCSAEDKARNMSAEGGCPSWQLRKLSTWGGSRRFTNNKNKE